MNIRKKFAVCVCYFIARIKIGNNIECHLKIEKTGNIALPVLQSLFALC